MLQTMLLAENGNLPVSLLVGIIVIVVLIFSLLLVFLSHTVTLSMLRFFTAST